MTTRAATVNFVFYPHATFSEEVVLKDADDVPLDLTGYSARMQVRRDRDDETPLYDLTTTVAATGHLVLGTTDGKVTILIPATATEDHALQDPDGESWAYDLLLTHPAGTVDRIIQGRISVRPGVTRPA